MQKLIIRFFLFLLVSACAGSGTMSVVNSESELKLDLATDIVFELLPPASFGADLNLVQSATISYDGDDIELLFYLEINQDEVVIVGMLPVGTRLFTIIYDGESIQSEGHSQTLERIQAKYLIADLQFSLWPTTLLNNAFESSNACFRTKECIFSESLDRSSRLLSHSDEDILAISYIGDWLDTGEIIYQNFPRAYQLRVLTLEASVE